MTTLTMPEANISVPVVGRLELRRNTQRGVDQTALTPIDPLVDPRHATAQLVGCRHALVGDGQWGTVGARNIASISGTVGNLRQHVYRAHHGSARGAVDHE